MLDVGGTQSRKVGLLGWCPRPFDKGQITYYGPPGSDVVAASLIFDFHTAIGGHRDSWVAVGDATGEPEDCDISHAWRAVGGHLVTDKKPTRWNSSRCVDWFCTNRPGRLRWLGHLDHHLSDHMVILAQWEEVNTVGEQWRQKLESHWTEQQRSAAGQQLAALLEAPANINVQEEWDLFVTMLSATYKSATEACLEGFSSAVSFPANTRCQQGLADQGRYAAYCSWQCAARHGLRHRSKRSWPNVWPRKLRLRSAGYALGVLRLRSRTGL